MNSAVYLIRFFHVVSPVPRLTLTTFVVLVVAASVKVVLDPAHAAGALMPLLVLQTFAASSGFAGPARRGYYDLLLTRGDGRIRIALVQWLASVSPGIAAWLTVAVVESVVTFGHGAAATSSGTLTTMFLVSTLPWAITVPLPRFAGAIGWLLVFVTAMAFASPGTWSALLQAWPGTGEEDGLLASVSVLVFPVALVGRNIEASWVLVAPAIVLAIAAMSLAFIWIHRTDIALEAAQ